MNLHRVFSALLVAAGALSLAGCGGCKPPEARFVRETAWIGKGQWLKAETHIHTKFSDGSHSVSEVADQAIRFGCDVIAITDHADAKLKAATPQYAEAIQAARESYPGLLILAGLEWNMPPWGGDEHVTVLVPPGADQWRNLAAFKQQFDDLGRKPHETAVADQGLRWLAEHAGANDERPVVLDNHPSRARARSMELVADFQHWRSVNDLVIGFEGAPGHQRLESPGDYKYKERTVDRWDPAVARVGDAWDTLLQQGLDAWASLATTDLHRATPAANYDYWPGEFAETWVYAPERTPAGVLRALRAGSFFASHGHIVREVELTVDAAGLPRPASSGEVIEVPPRMKVKVTLRFTVPAKDWEGKPNRIDTVELIAVTAEGARVVASRPPATTGPALFEELEVPTGGMVVRARGRRALGDGSGLMFYTNPVRILLRDPR